MKTGIILTPGRWRKSNGAPNLKNCRKLSATETGSLFASLGYLIARGQSWKHINITQRIQLKEKKWAFVRELGEITYSLGILEDIQLIYKFMRYGFSHLSTIKSAYKEMFNVTINTERVFYSYQGTVLKNKSVICIVSFLSAFENAINLAITKEFLKTEKINSINTGKMCALYRNSRKETGGSNHRGRLLTPWPTGSASSVV